MLRYAQLALSFSLLLFVGSLTGLSASSGTFAQANQSCEPSLIHQITVGNEYIALGNLAWSPDGRYILALYVQGNELDLAIREGMYVIDGTTFEILHDIERSLSASFADAILWSPDSQQVAIAYLGTVTLWNVANWTASILEVPDTDEAVMQMVWSEDSSQLGVASHDRMRTWPLREPGEVVRVWDVESRQVLDTLGSSTEAVLPSLVKARLSYANGGWLVATLAEAESQVQVRVLGEAETILEVPANDLADFVNTASGVRLAVVQIPEVGDQSQGILNVWNVDAQTQEFTLSGRANSLAAITRLFPENDLIRVRTGGLEHVVHDLSTNVSLDFEYQWPIPSRNGEFLAVFRLDSPGLAGSAEGTVPPPSGERSLGPSVPLINMDSGETIATLYGTQGTANMQPWSPDGEMLVVTFDPNKLGIWSLEGCQ